MNKKEQMTDIEEKIEDILCFSSEWEDYETKGGMSSRIVSFHYKKAIKELATLIQKREQEAVRGFVEWLTALLNERNPEGKNETANDITDLINLFVETYLSQTKGGKE